MKDKIITVLSAITGVFMVAAYWFAKQFFSQKKKTDEVSKSLEKQKENAEILAEHTEKVTEIKKEKAEKIKEVKEAKNDEEIIAAVNSVIANNNKRVRKSSKKSTNPSA